MTRIYIETEIEAPLVQVFDLARSIDLHLESTSKTNERAIAGVTKGLIRMGESVTWRAKHFGIYQNFTSKITQFDMPNSFTDEMQKGAFKSFKHLHTFSKKEGKTVMADVLDFEAPLGILGRIAERLVLKSYLTKFLVERNALIKSVAEIKQLEKEAIVNREVVLVEESFSITGRGVIVFLQHPNNGLPKGLTLKSNLTGNIWDVTSRVISDHAVEVHRFFDVESNDFMRLNFKDLETRSLSIARIKEQESNNIYQYLLKPIGHNEKPVKGEVLIIGKA